MRQVKVVTLATEAARVLGEVADGHDAGPAWSAGSDKVRMLMTENLNKVSVQEFPLNGAVSTYEIPFETDKAVIQGPVSSSPDGARLVGTGADFSSHQGQLVSVDLEARHLTALAPAGRIWQWVGNDTLLCSVGHTWLQHYYLVKVTP